MKAKQNYYKIDSLNVNIIINIERQFIGKGSDFPSITIPF